MLTPILVILLFIYSGYWCWMGSPISCSVLAAAALIVLQLGRILSQLREMSFDAADDS